jgi:hypothetical protein
MARKGEQVAAAPVPRWENLAVGERVGRTVHLETTWRVTCACGWQTVGEQRAIRNGACKCPTCNPFRVFAVDRDARAIRALLPATYAQIMRQMGFDRHEVERRVNTMRNVGWCHIGDYARPEAQGLFCPIFYPGPGKDAKCKLKPVPKNTIKRNYEKRVRAAVEQAEMTGIVVPRYQSAIRKIRSRRAQSIVQQAVAKPQNPFSALGL